MELRAGLEGRTLVVEVVDRGPGLGGDAAEQLFEPFSRGTGVDGVPGRGVGLFLVRMLARSLGGTATLDERPAGGVRLGSRFHSGGHRSGASGGAKGIVQMRPQRQ